jgi:hypothetical protein
MASPVAEYCAQHPDRHGCALCMSCRKVVCQECATTWDGVNLCRSCLASRGATAASRRQIRAWVSFAVFCAAALWVAAHGLAWSAAMLARLR